MKSYHHQAVPSRTEPGNTQAFREGTVNLSLRGAYNFILEAHTVLVFVCSLSSWWKYEEIILTLLLHLKPMEGLIH